jgi:uncharacterized protein (TIGR02677 family)
MNESPPDSAKVHGALRDLVHIFAGLSNNAEAFMAGLARTIELQRADVAAVMGFKTRLIDYLQRFIGDLVTRSSQIAELLLDLAPAEPLLLRLAAERDARNAVPNGADTNEEALRIRLDSWAERWEGLKLWFLSNGRERSQAELLRASAPPAGGLALARAPRWAQRSGGRLSAARSLVCRSPDRRSCP